MLNKPSKLKHPWIVTTIRVEELRIPHPGLVVDNEIDFHSGLAVRELEQRMFGLECFRDVAEAQIWELFWQT